MPEDPTLASDKISIVIGGRYGTMNLKKASIFRPKSGIDVFKLAKSGYFRECSLQYDRAIFSVKSWISRLSRNVVLERTALTKVFDMIMQASNQEAKAG